MKITAEKLNKALFVAVITILSVILGGSIFYFGRQAYLNSKESVKETSYWLPGQYRMVRTMPDGDDYNTIASIDEFQRAFGDEKVCVYVDNEHVRYYVDKGGVLFVSKPIRLDVDTWGLSIDKVELEKPGRVVLVGHQSWFKIAIVALYLGGIVGLVLSSITLAVIMVGDLLCTKIYSFFTRNKMVKTS